MLGGGNFTTQNKVLPGAYVNIVSANSVSSNMGERGYVAMALPLPWGVDGAIFTVTASAFRKNALQIFGFEYDSEEAKGLRDLFKNITTLFCYKLMNGGAKASNSISEAKYKGSFGTQISTEIVVGTAQGTYDVNVYVGTSLAYSKTVSSVAELKAEDNPWVTWTIDTLAETAKTSLSGNDLDGADATVTQHTEFLTAAEAYTFNAMGCVSNEDAIKELYIQACKDARDNSGIKYQLVVFNKAADYEGVVNVKNSLDAVWWTTGAVAGCPVNSSNTNKTYDGEFVIPADYSKAELELAIESGEFVFHRVADEIRVLEDINSLKTTSATKGEDFKSNQTIRVVDQIAMDIAKIFNSKYLGKIPNDKAGRISLWSDIVNHHQELQNIRAIEDFSADDVVIEQGDTKKSVVVTDSITVVNAMSQLYMSVIVN